MRNKRLGIAGAGRLGSTLARALDAGGYSVRAVSSRSPAHAAQLAEELSNCDSAELSAIAVDCEVVFLAVPDACIQEACERVSWGRHHSVVHTSGSRGLDVLDSAARSGASVGCLHPIQSFPSLLEQPERFARIVCGIEAHGSLSRELESLVGDLGASPLRLEGVDRAAYHAAAVLASNLVVGLVHAATRAWELAGLPTADARRALAPLTAGAADAIADQSLAEALTGPVARGDIDTLARHSDVLGSVPSLWNLYAAATLELLRMKLPLEESERMRMAEIFDAFPHDENPILNSPSESPVSTEPKT